MKIEKRKIGEGVYLLRFQTQYEMTATFLRVQEHYESPRFHGQIFDLEEYMDWYAAENGNFTYYEDWSGFNVPSTALEPFYEGKFDPLSRKERQLLSLFRGVRKPYYVIGVYGRGADSLKHEAAHALFFVDQEYRKQVLESMRDYDASGLARKIEKSGYARHVLPDETQAYLIAPSSGLGRGFKALEPLRRKLRALFNRHSTRLKIRRV